MYLGCGGKGQFGEGLSQLSSPYEAITSVQHTPRLYRQSSNSAHFEHTLSSGKEEWGMKNKFLARSESHTSIIEFSRIFPIVRFLLKYDFSHKVTVNCMSSGRLRVAFLSNRYAV